jgi:zinc protease
LDEIQARWQRYYKPRNAILVLAGDVDVAAARRMIAAHFGKLPPGERIPRAHEAGPARFGAVRELRVKSRLPLAESTACLAYVPPRPQSELYAPLLVLISRLWAGSAKFAAGGPTGTPVLFTPLDDGAVLGVSAKVRPGETSAQAFSRIESFVAQTLEPKLGPLELFTARRRVGFLLAIVDVPDEVLAQNPYGLAFGLGRREQLGIDPAGLKKAWDAVTDETLRRAATEVFAPSRHAGALIAIVK